jgi:hypothetical protein
MAKKVVRHRRHPAHDKSRSKKVEPALELTVQEFHHHPKDQYWYIGVGLLLAAVAFGLAWSHNYLLAVVAVALGLAVFRLANIHPESRAVRISDRGIYWGSKFLGFHQFKGFWLAETGETIAFYLERPNFAPLVSFVVPDSQAGTIFEALVEHLPHHHHKGEPLADQASRLFRF